MCERVFNKISVGGGILFGTGIEKYIYTIYKVTMFPVLRIFLIILKICHFPS